MENIKISAAIKEKCPDLILGCLSCHVKWGTGVGDLKTTIGKACDDLQLLLKTPDISQLEAIASSRKGYKALGKDPSRYRLSAEALLRRVVKGKGLYQINNIVDTLNMVSIQTGYSIGGYDIATIEGDILLGIGEEGEAYQGIGKGDLNIANLPVFRDDKGAFGTPTSDSTRTMVTERTERFLMIFLNFSSHENMQQVLEDTKELYKKHTQATNIEIATIR
jgi:DNA/RNA-binding domain of Phe-tRNA-synthetase-like protein